MSMPRTRRTFMTKYQIFGVALVLSAAVATPALAEAIQEPGLHSFYHPNSDLGIGSSRPSEAMAAQTLQMSVKTRHINRASAIKRH
jgi:hypothetical protein